MDKQNQDESIPVEISEQDIIEAMKSIHGYIDITPGDFKEVYKAAYALAVKRLLDTLKAGDIMSTPIQSIHQDVELVDAAAMLAEKNISGAPVVDLAGKVIGVVSEKDFLKEMGVGMAPSFMQIANHCLNDKSCMINKLRKRTVSDIMTSPAITAGPEFTVRQISALFIEKGINRLPIVSAEQCPMGIVTRTDLAHSFSILGRGMKK
jgi:CBS domain-containing membrane protein